MANIKFYKKATEPSGIDTGNIWFDTTSHSIKIKTAGGYDVFGVGLKNATLSGGVLTITRYDDTTVTVDFNDIASATSVAKALEGKVDKTTAIVTEAGSGLIGGKTLNSNVTLSHDTSDGAMQKGIGFYKLGTDKFGHAVNLTPIAKTDITGLGIPGSDTTYTFTSGTNSFSVKPSNGSAQTITVTPSIANNVTKTSADTTAGYIPKFNNTAGVIENGYSVQTTLSSSSTAIPTAAAVSAAIDGKIAAADAMIYKGTLGTGGTVTTVPIKGYKTGWTYKVITAGTYAGHRCEIGDMLIAIKNGPSEGTSVINADWTVVQSNIDGAVTGPASAVDGHVALFDGATGKVIKDSGFTIKKDVPSTAVFTDTKVTSVDNHYKPSGGTAAAETAGSAVAYGGKVITGVTKDAAGHVTGVTTGTIPAAPTISSLNGISDVSINAIAPLKLSSRKDDTTIRIDGSITNMKGATDSVAGFSGLVPAPEKGENNRFLKGDGTWAIPVNTNTTYTFANGSAGNFTVTPSSGSAQTVSIGKPATAGTSDKVGHTLSISLGSSAPKVFDGSTNQSISVTPETIGAATSAQGSAAQTAIQAVVFKSDTLLGNVSKAGTAVTITVNSVWEEFE